MKDDQVNSMFDSVDDEKVLEQARKSGLSYNETIAWMARTTGGHGTQIYSDTDVDAVKKANEGAEKD